MNISPNVYFDADHAQLLTQERIGILFVCMGNICRSPTAEGVMRKLVHDAGLENRITVDSAGTHDYYAGEPPDPRAQAVALRRGYDLSALRARQIEESDFQRFDLLLAMDRNNLGMLQCMCPVQYRHKIRLLTAFASYSKNRVIHDPFARKEKDFDRVLNDVEDACSGLLGALTGSPAHIPNPVNMAQPLQGFFQRSERFLKRVFVHG